MSDPVPNTGFEQPARAPQDWLKGVWQRVSRGVSRFRDNSPHGVRSFRENFTFSYGFLFAVSFVLLFVYLPSAQGFPWWCTVCCASLALLSRLAYIGLLFFSGNAQKEERRFLLAFLLPLLLTLANYFLVGIADPALQRFAFSSLLQVCRLNALTYFISLYHHCPNPKHPQISFFVKHAALFVWGFTAARLLHGAYLAGGCLRNLWDGYFLLVFPFSLGHPPAAALTMGNAVSLFTGCLIIVNWFRKRPCEEWNPYTAKELNLTWNYFDFAIVLFSASLYAFSQKLNRFSLGLTLVLLAVDISIYYLCNGQGNEKAVRQAIIRKIKPEKIAWNIRNQPALGIRDSATAGGDELPDAAVPAHMISAMVNYARTIADISRTVLKSENDPEQAVRHFLDIVNTMDTMDQRLLEEDGERVNILYTMGFVLGFAALPTAPPKDVPPQRLKAYSAMLFKQFSVNVIAERYGEASEFMRTFMYWAGIGLYSARWRMYQQTDAEKNGEEKNGVEKSGLKKSGAEWQKTKEKLDTLAGKNGQPSDVSIFFSWFRDRFSSDELNAKKQSPPCWEWMERMYQEL